jgi:3-oxoacyl-[acyl-carrier protein] reductase
MKVDLAGKRVLVTGASIGIGREVALRFAAEGSSLVLTYHEHRAEAEEAAERCLGVGASGALVQPLQLADEASIRALAEAVADRLGGLDILVNSAGVISWDRFLEQDLATIETQLMVNLVGVMKLTWALLPMLTDAVITIGSTAALHRSRTPPPYVAAKWGIRGFTKALAHEHPGKRIVCVHPTVTATRMNDFRGMPPERVAEVVVAVARGDIAVEQGGDVDLRDHAG